MRWVRTAATTITSTAAAGAVLWMATTWLIAPRLDEWAKNLIEETTTHLRGATSANAEQIEQLEDVVVALNNSVDLLSKRVTASLAPSWRFSRPDTHISDGYIGGRVLITAGGYKLRECGIPRVDLYFVNGNGTYHRFVDNSLLSDTNRGVAFNVDPGRVQTVRYTARIPANDDVKPGRAQGYISVTYPDGCPEVEEVVAGPLQFRITAAP